MMARTASRLRKEMLDLLEKDLEFRYAVAGYLGISEMMKRLDSIEENILKIWEEIKGIKEDIRGVKEGIKEVKGDVKGIKEDVKGIHTTLDRLTITVEEEARSVIKHRIKENLGIDIELDRVFINSKEINIYGAKGDICVIGEATVRLGTRLVKELQEKIEFIERNRPDLLRKRVIKVIYTDYAVPEAIEAAKESGIWLIKWDRDLTSLIIENKQL